MTAATAATAARVGGFTVGYFVGSLSRESINRMLANALIRLAPEALEFTEISIGDLPLYNRDLDPDYPPPARALKARSSRSTRCCSSRRSTTATSPED